VFLINDLLQSGWNFLLRQIELEIINDLVQSLVSHLILLELIVLRVLDRSLDSLLELILLQLSLLFDGTLSLLSSGGKFSLKSRVLHLTLVRKLILDLLVNVVELIHDSLSILLVRRVVDLLLESHSLLDSILVWVKVSASSKFLDFLLDLLILLIVLLVCDSLLLDSNTSVMLTKLLLISSLFLHLLHKDAVLVDLVVDSID